MPRRTHPGRKRARRNFAKLNARQESNPAGRRSRHRPPRCEECSARENVEQYDATPIVGTRRRPDKPRAILLCPACLRERSASWRWHWRITGRALPEDGRAVEVDRREV